MRKCCSNGRIGPIKCAIGESAVSTADSLTAHFIGEKSVYFTLVVFRSRLERRADGPPLPELRPVEQVQEHEGQLGQLRRSRLHHRILLAQLTDRPYLIYRGIRNPGVKQCFVFCAADFWSLLA